jgi:DNA-binding MarR family transcriptional regulator
VAKHRRHPDARAAAEGLARTAPLVSRWIERLLAGHAPPLTVAQFLVLQSVGDGEVVGSELARRAAVSPAAVSQLLATLESAGLVERTRGTDDRRRQPLTLTPIGETTLRSARTLLHDRLGELLADMPPPEVDALGRLLTRLEASLTGKAPPPRPHRPPPPPHHRM